MRVKFCVVGGGPHGVTITHFLLSKGVLADDICIVDPHSTLMERFFRVLKSTCVTYMRGGLGSHIAANEEGLERYARERWNGDLTSKYGNIPSRLFEGHARQEIAVQRTESLHLRDELVALHREGKRFRVVLSSGTELLAKYVILAPGLEHHPLYPAWVEEPWRSGPSARMRHVMQQQFAVEAVQSPWKHAVIIGSGVAGVQVAIELAGQAPVGARVTLLSMHPIVVSRFDCDETWLDPQVIQNFLNSGSVEDRRNRVIQARRIGTILPELRDGLSVLESSGRVTFRRGMINAATSLNNGGFSFRVGDQTSVDAEVALLATGLLPSPPGGVLLARVAETLGAARTNARDPVLTNQLQWEYPELFVSGTAAETVLGPMAGTIPGARMAAQRILQACHLQ